jgi:hypothetical protein
MNNTKHVKGAVNEKNLEDISQYIEREPLIYDNNGTESVEFCAMLAQLTVQEFRFKKLYNLEGGLNAWKEAGFQTVATGTLTPALPLVPTSSPTAMPSPASTPTPTTATTAEPSSQTPGFEAMSVVLGILISIATIKTRKQNVARR